MPGFHLKSLELDGSQTTAYGSGLSFDFSDEIPDGEQILAYAVALTACDVNYATQSSVSYEPVERFAIKLVPSLADNVVAVSVGLILTDYDGDAASEPQDVEDRLSLATVTVIAYADTSADNSWRLCNAFDLASGKWSDDIPVPAGDPLYSRVMIAGFDFEYSDNDSHGVDALQVLTGLEAGTQSNTVQIQGSCTMDAQDKYDPPRASVDLAYLFQPTPQPGAVSTIQFVDITPSWGDVSDSGMSASFSETVTVPDGYQLAAAALVMSRLDLDFGGYHDVGTIVTGLHSTTPTYTVGATGETEVSGTLRMNLYADELPDKQIASDSSISASIVAVFKPLPAS